MKVLVKASLGLQVYELCLLWAPSCKKKDMNCAGLFDAFGYWLGSGLRLVSSGDL